MLRKKIFALLFLLPVAGFGQNIEYKMIQMRSPAVGQYMLHILPQRYDTAIPDREIAKCIDTLPGHLFGAKMYNLLYREDTAKLAVKAEEGVYLFHRRYTIEVYWKNGNKKRIAFVNKHFRKYREWNYYDNDAPRAFGRYGKIKCDSATNCTKKKGRWVYFDTQGKKVKVERYSRNGTLKKTKTFNPPKKTLRTAFNPRHLGGTPYIIEK